MKILKRISILVCIMLTILSFFCVPTYAYTEPDCILSEVKIDEEGQVLGYGDTLHMSCKVISNYEIDKVVFWIRTLSKNISFDMEYDVNTEKYIKNQTLNEDMLETAYSTFSIDIWYNKDGKQCIQSAYGDTDFPEQDFVFNNNCKNNNHSYNDGTITKSASCQYEGIKTYVCSICNTSKNESIPKTNHTIIIDNSIPATYTKSGLTKGSHCSVCGTVIEAQKPIPKLSQKEQKITLEKSNYIFKSKSLKNKKSTFLINAKVLGKCKLKYAIKQYPKNAKKYISVNKSGRVTLKKGIKKGKYKISITAVASKEYSKAVKTINITIK